MLRKGVPAESEQTGRRTLKVRLESGRVYFETIVMSSLTIMGIMVTIASVVVSCGQLSLSRTQAEIELAKSEPYFIYAGCYEDGSSGGAVHRFENLGEMCREASIAMADDVFVLNQDSPLYVVDVKIGGRYHRTAPSDDDGRQVFEVSAYEGDSKVLAAMDCITKAVVQDGGLSWGMSNGKTVEISYVMPNGESRADSYLLLDGMLVARGSAGDPYRGARLCEVPVAWASGDFDEEASIVSAYLRSLSL